MCEKNTGYNNLLCVCVVGVIRRGVECRQKCRSIFFAQGPFTKAFREVGKDWKHSTSHPFHYTLHLHTLSLDHYFSLQEHGFTAQPCCPGDRCQATATGEAIQAAGSSQSVSNGMDPVCIINTGTDLELHEYFASVVSPQPNLDTHTKLSSSLVGHSGTFSTNSQKVECRTETYWHSHIFIEAPGQSPAHGAPLTKLSVRNFEDLFKQKKRKSCD